MKINEQVWKIIVDAGLTSIGVFIICYLMVAIEYWTLDGTKFPKEELIFMRAFCSCTFIFSCIGKWKQGMY